MYCRITIDPSSEPIPYAAMVGNDVFVVTVSAVCIHYFLNKQLTTAQQGVSVANISTRLHHSSLEQCTTTTGAFPTYIQSLGGDG